MGFPDPLKGPPLDIIDCFLKKFGHAEGGSICTDQGGELAGLSDLADMILRKHSYIFEPTGAGSPSQNGGAETYSDKLAIRTHTLLYGAGLPAKYWSSALIHAVYLQNCLVTMSTQCTPFKDFYGHKPDLSGLKTFGSWVCVKCTGRRRSKLDCHDFSRIFIGYTTSDQNIAYINLDSGLVKTSHHAQFDEAWYLQPSCPLATQLLYDLGLEADNDVEPDPDPHPAPYPPITTQKVSNNLWKTPPRCCHLPLPLRCTMAPQPVAAAAARIVAESPEIANRCLCAMILASAIADDYRIEHEAMKMIYMSPIPTMTPSTNFLTSAVLISPGMPLLVFHFWSATAKCC